MSAKAKDLADTQDEPTNKPEAPRRRPSLLERRKFSSELQPKVRLQIDKFKTSACAPANPWQGEYKLLESLGHGSTSTVQRAVRLSDRRQVALKTMISREAEMLRVAQAEFHALLRLSHPNIVNALEFYIRDGQAALVMDCFDGVHLDALVKRYATGLPENTVRTLAAQLFKAVAHIHDRGMIHRDIKPMNTLITLQPVKLMVIDFNTSCDWLRESSSLTPAGEMLYMAPEEVRGQPSTRASDIWSAGLCAFLALSGRLPQRRDRTELDRSSLERVSSQAVEFKGRRWEQVSQPCKDVLARCMGIEQSSRPVAAQVLKDPWFEAEQDACSLNAPAASAICQTTMNSCSDESVPQGVHELSELPEPSEIESTSYGGSNCGESVCFSEEEKTRTRVHKAADAQ